MTDKILKYPLKGFASVGVVELPEDWMLLSVQVQNNEPVLYVTGTPDAPKVGQIYYCLHTGDNFPEEASIHIGTAMLNKDKYVLHYFI